MSEAKPKGKHKIKIMLAAIFLTSAILLTIAVFLEFSPMFSNKDITPENLSPHYLPYPDSQSEYGKSKVFLVSTTTNYGVYPFEPLFPSIPSQIRKGDPCLIINVTIRNDYTLDNPPPNQAKIYYPNGTFTNVTSTVVVRLTAAIFNSQGQVNATDVTPPYPIGALRGATETLHSGESKTLTIYLATNNRDIIRFEIIPQHIGTTPPT